MLTTWTHWHGRRGSVVSVVAVVAIAVVAAVLTYRARHVHVDLYSTTVGIQADGERALIRPGSAPDFYPGTRVLRTREPSAAEVRAAASQQRWVESGLIPMHHTRYGSMSKAALLDINTLTIPVSGGLVAAWSENWRYVWPRDAAFAAAALAQTGHMADAVRNLKFLQGVQGRDGTFQARYPPDGSPVTDERGIQLDGTGWSLWGAFWAVRHATSASEQREIAAQLAPLITTSTDAVMRLTDNGIRLPPVSPDYWETKEDKLTLATAAVTLCGLRSAASIYQLTDDPRRLSISRRADEVEAAIHRTFGPEGYPRTLGGKVDTAVAFLLPPFQPSADSGVTSAFQAAARQLRRPAGGLAPGAGWKQDGISWTPETSVFALAASYMGDRDEADVWLTWLDHHRTTAGSIPEKVLHDGSPAAVAPLAWSSATVLLTLSRLCADAGRDCMTS